MAVRARLTETRLATRLLLAAGKRYSATAASRPFETGNGQPAGYLRIADQRQTTQRKGGDEGKGSTLVGPTEESEVWSI
jgi:hypothetical protein